MKTPLKLKADQKDKLYVFISNEVFARKFDL